MDKKLLNNFKYNILYQIVLVLSPIIITPYTTRVLEDDLLGINAWTASITQWFIIFGVMGISIYGSKAIALVRDDHDKLSRTFWEVFSLQVILLTISTILFYLFITMLNIEYYNILLIQGISIISCLFDITWFYVGIEDFKKASIRNVIVKITGIVLIFIFVRTRNDLPVFILINTLTGLFGQLIMWINLNNYTKFIFPTMKGILKHFKPNFILFIPQIAISIYVVLDQTLLGIITTPEEVAYYSVTQRFIKMFLFFVTTIGTVMLPRISNMHAKGKLDGINRYIGYTFRIALYISIPMMFGIIAVGPYFSAWFLAKEYTIVGLLLGITAPVTIFISISNVFGIQYMIPLGLNKQYTISVIVGAIVNFILNLILIYFYGAIGASIASVIAELSVTLVQWLYIKDRIKFDVYGNVIRYFIAGLIMCIIVYYIGTMMSYNIISNLVQIVLGIIIYFIIVTLLKDSFNKLVINKALELVRYNK